MRRCLIYSRVSTDRQAEEGYSLETQLVACRTYARQHDMTIAAEISDDVSGAILDRPGLSEARILIADGHAEAIIIYSGDRLSRDVAHAALLRQEFKRAGCELHYVMRGQVRDDPYAETIEHILTAIAELERSLIRERMMRGRRGKVDAGLVPGQGKAPFGYQYVQNGPHSGRFEIIESQAQTVQQIYAWYLAGIGVADIAERLAAAATASPGDISGQHRKQMAFASWNRRSIYNILQNAAYRGEFHAYRYESVHDGDKKRQRKRPKADWVGIPVPAIVNDIQWYQAQERMRTGMTFSPRNAKRFYLLGRRIICGLCGRKAASTTDNHTLPVRIHRCPHSQATSVNPCAAPRFRADRVESAVWTWIERIILDDEVLTDGLAEKERARIEQSVDTTTTRTALESERTTVEQRRLRLLDLYETNAIDQSLLRQRMQELDSQRGTLQVQIESLATPATVSSLDLRARVDDVRTLLSGAVHDEDRRAVIDTLDVWTTLHMRDGVRSVFIEARALGLDTTVIIE